MNCDECKECEILTESQVSRIKDQVYKEGSRISPISIFKLIESHELLRARVKELEQNTIPSGDPRVKRTK